MSNAVIPREQLTACERWELASFDHPTGLSSKGINALTTAAIMEEARQLAHQEGYAIGHQAGYAEGIQQARIEAEKIHALMQSLQVELHQVDQQVAQSLLDLSLEIARKMVQSSLHANPDVILNIVSEAISNLPHFNQNAHLILHPDDAELVRKQMGDQLTQAGWKIFSDAKIQRGGCRVETSSSQIDGTVENRWKRIVESIGQDTSWLT